MTKQRDGISEHASREPAEKKETSDGMSHKPGSGTSIPEDAISTGLKRIFDDIVKEPIPPEFLDLLNRIDRKDD
jgi:hypothetical protein